MKNFFFKNYISILVGLLIVVGLFRTNLSGDHSFSSKKSLQKGGFSVYNHSAIHALYYQGDFNEYELMTISTIMDEHALFLDKKPAVLGLVKRNDSLALMRMTTLEYQEETPKKELSLYSLLAYTLKNKLFPDHKISLNLTDEQWNPQLTINEEQLGDYLIQNEEKVHAEGTTPVSTKNEEELRQILDRWTKGATTLSQAQFYFPVRENDDWRIYYSPIVSEQVSSLAQVLFEAGFFQESSSNFLAFYTQADPQYFNGEASYVVAIPFPESQLNNETASKTLEAVHKFLKQGYFRSTNLITLGTDYDFQPVFLRY